MKQRFRLIRSRDIRRVRNSRKSYAHPFFVLYVMNSNRASIRVGVSAGRTVGNAVQRNRAKRLLRAAMNVFLPEVIPGFDLLLVARAPLARATLEETKQALTALLTHSGLTPV